MTDIEYGKSYWKYADEREEWLRQKIHRIDIGKHLRQVFDHFKEIDLNEKLSTKEVIRLHDQIDDWMSEGLSVREYQIRLRDIKRRRTISQREFLDIWMLFSFCAFYQEVLEAAKPVFRDVARKQYELAFTQAKQITGKGRLNRPHNMDSIMNQVNPSLGRTITDQLWVESQYHKNIFTAQFESAAITKASPNLNSVQNQERLQRIERQLLAKSKKTNVEPNGHHGIIDKQMSFIIGYTVLGAFEDAGVKKYKFISVIDEATTSVCHKLNGQIFDIKDAKLGVNVPPVGVDENGLPIPHPCRSIIRVEA